RRTVDRPRRSQTEESTAEGLTLTSGISGAEAYHLRRQVLQALRVARGDPVGPFVTCPGLPSRIHRTKVLADAAQPQRRGEHMEKHRPGESMRTRSAWLALISL